MAASIRWRVLLVNQFDLGYHQDFRLGFRLSVLTIPYVCKEFCSVLDAFEIILRHLLFDFKMRHHRPIAQVDSPVAAAVCVATMAKYIARKCPKCRDDFWVVVNQPPHSHGEHPIKAYCALCGYRLDGWQLILGGKRPPETLISRMRKALS